MEQLILHLIGDYLLQSDWMAVNKGRQTFPAFCHATLYSLPFLLIGSFPSVTIIWATHLLIDRLSLARYVVRTKNILLAPCSAGNREPMARRDMSAMGFRNSTPIWMIAFLTVAADNTLHLTINYLALGWLTSVQLKVVENQLVAYCDRLIPYSRSCK